MQDQCVKSIVSLLTANTGIKNSESFMITQKWNTSQELVAYSCNPSYSGGRDQEDWFEASPCKWFTRSYLKKKIMKKGGRSGSSGRVPT
jgi:hypothetical protein